MLTQEDVVEIHALRRRGWTIAAIARHTGRDPKTIRRRLSGWESERGSAPSPLEPWRRYLEARFADDPHLFATVLHRELRELGFDRSYPTLVREIRKLGLRPECGCCRRGEAATVELTHEPGAELQLGSSFPRLPGAAPPTCSPASCPARAAFAASSARR